MAFTGAITCDMEKLRGGMQMERGVSAKVGRVGDSSSRPMLRGESSRAQGKDYPPPLHSHEEVVSDKALFMESLRKFHSSMGTKFMNPVIGGKELNLHLLYVEVARRGGFENVMETGQWREVVAAFDFPPTITSASYAVRKYYLSLLRHYEQVYFFRTQGPPVPPAASMETKTPLAKQANRRNASDSTMHQAGTAGKRTIHELLQETDGKRKFTVEGTIDGKFEHGYMVTIQIGHETLRGVLYRFNQQIPFAVPVIPLPGAVMPFATAVSAPHTAVTGFPSATPLAVNPLATAQPRGGPRRRVRRYSAPGHPKPNRSAYNFFFAEKHAMLKNSHPNKEREFSKMIGEAWNKLTEDERTVYKNQAAEDKERYRRELVEYRSGNEASAAQGLQKLRNMP